MNGSANKVEQSSGFEIKHYIDLLLRKKWLILLITGLVCSLWIVFLFQLGMMTPILEAQAILAFDDPRNISAVDGGAGILAIDSKIGLIRSRTFLNSVAKKLALQLKVKDFSRSDIFTSIEIDTAALLGKYSLELAHPGYTILFTNKQLGIKDKPIKTGNLNESDSLSLENIHLAFSPRYLENPHSFTFYLVRIRDIVDNLLLNLEARPADFRRTLLAVRLKGRDYHLITETVNMIADEFVDFNLSFKKRKTREVLEVLERQLSTAKKEMEISQENLKNFREKYPRVGLQQDAVRVIGELSQMETSIYNNTVIYENAQQLKMRYLNRQNEDEGSLVNEMISFLNSNRVAVAPAMLTEINQLLIERNTLANQYSLNHPIMLENKNKIISLGVKVNSALDNFIAEIQSGIDQNQRKIRDENSRMYALPAREKQLADLDRQARVDADIYQAILVRYNESKISDAVEVGDTYIMDYAVVPESPVNLIGKLKKLVIGLFLGLGAALALVFALDFFDHTVNSDEELKRKIDIPLIESIPVITADEEKIDTVTKSRIDPKLITAQYTQNLVNESYRSLRAKLVYAMKDVNPKSIAITSLNQGEGKSLTASNLAVTFAQSKIPTLFIDCDMRRGVIHHSFSLKKRPGLSELLSSRQKITIEFIRSFIQSSHIPNLFILSSGQQVPNPTELLSTPRFGEFFEIVQQYFNMVIIDTPPLGIISDAAVIYDKVSRYLVIARAASTNISDLRKRIHSFPNVMDRLLGIVLNAVPLRKKELQNKYSYYNY